MKDIFEDNSFLVFFKRLYWNGLVFSIITKN